jgi:hypothetical protein
MGNLRERGRPRIALATIRCQTHVRAGTHAERASRTASSQPWPKRVSGSR